MLQPVRTKWRKAHKGRIHGKASRANFINYGAYALKALSPETVTEIKVKLNNTLERDSDDNIITYAFANAVKGVKTES